jgi:hypothetical protein
MYRAEGPTITSFPNMPGAFCTASAPIMLLTE